MPTRTTPHGALHRLGRLGPRSWALAVGLLALLCRLPLLGSSIEYPDSADYLGAAADVVNGDGFATAGEYRTPGYPLFLVAVRLLPGPTPEAAAAVQHVVGIALAVALVLLGRRWLGTAAGVMAGSLAAIAPLLTNVEHIVTPDFLYGALAFAGIALMIEALRDPDRPRWAGFVAAGAVFGIAALVKPSGQLLVAIAPLGVLLALRQWRPALKATACVGLATLVVITPWLVRNQVQYGHLTLSIQGRHSLWMRAFDTARLPVPTETADGRFAKAEYDRTYLAATPDEERASYTHVLNAFIAEGRTPHEAIGVMGDLALTAMWRDPVTYATSGLEQLGKYWVAHGVSHEVTPSRAEVAAGDGVVPDAPATVLWTLGQIGSSIWWVLSIGTLAGWALVLARARPVRVAAGLLLAGWLVMCAGSSAVNHFEWRFGMQAAPETLLLGSAGLMAVAARVARSARGERLGRWARRRMPLA